MTRICGVYVTSSILDDGGALVYKSPPRFNVDSFQLDTTKLISVFDSMFGVESSTY